MLRLVYYILRLVGDEPDLYSCLIKSACHNSSMLIYFDYQLSLSVVHFKICE